VVKFKIGVVKFKIGVVKFKRKAKNERQEKGENKKRNRTRERERERERERYTRGWQVHKHLLPWWKDCKKRKQFSSLEVQLVVPWPAQTPLTAVDQSKFYQMSAKKSF
jgi:hypothetical protein